MSMVHVKILNFLMLPLGGTKYFCTLTCPELFLKVLL